MTTIDDTDDIEGKVRDLGRTISAPPLPGATAVMDRGRRRRRHRRGRLAAVVVVAGAGGALGVQALRSGEPAVRVTTADPADDGAGATSSVPPPTSSTSPTTASPGSGSTTPTDIAMTFVAVPNVIGLDNRRAVDVLEDAGFRVEVRVHGGHPDDAVVRAQAPAPAATVPPGSDIVLDVG